MKRSPEFKRNVSVITWLLINAMVWIFELPIIFFQIFITVASVSFLCFDMSDYYGEKIKEIEQRLSVREGECRI
jgi:hypothetical protein